MSDTVLRAGRPAPDHDPRRSRWIPWAFVGGMLLVVAVNVMLVYFALSTFTGVTVGQSYDRGRTYNNVIAEAARQDALGWRAQVALDGAVLSVAVADREGLPAQGRIEGVMLRPLDGTTLPLDFAAAGAGRFIAAAQPPMAGQWEARLVLHGQDGARFDIRERIFVREAAR
ncbi:FixH family protein [Falsiroseomonas sp. CW058]|uniref:FixH family protein n=1 Tax=Falsiroseomonas sp. CW058 TaxID=3388664 RepID=UPI003D3153C6